MLNLFPPAMGETPGDAVGFITHNGEALEIRNILKDGESLIYWLAVCKAGKWFQIDSRQLKAKMPENATTADRLFIVCEALKDKGTEAKYLLSGAQ